MKELTLIQPDDWHLHLRDSKALEAVAPDSARIFKSPVKFKNSQVYHGRWDNARGHPCADEL